MPEQAAGESTPDPGQDGLALVSHRKALGAWALDLWPGHLGAGGVGGWVAIRVSLGHSTVNASAVMSTEGGPRRELSSLTQPQLPT